MNEIFLNSVMAGVTLSFLAYGIGVLVQQRWKLAIFNPLLLAILLVMAFLYVFSVDYDTYYAGAKYLGFFLTPATVSLAIPLYQKLHLLRQNGKAIVCGILAGALTSLVCILLLSVLFRLSHEDYVTLLPKSITTAIGLDLSTRLGGSATITSAAIMVTGLMGNITGEFLCKLFRIRNRISRGLAIGTASHAMGTAKAMQMGDVEGAMSSLAIVIAGVSTVVGASIFSLFW